MAQVGTGQGALDVQKHMVDFDFHPGTDFVCVFILDLVGHCIKYLFTGQRADVEEEAVGDLPYHKGQV